LLDILWMKVAVRMEQFRAQGCQRNETHGLVCLPDLARTEDVVEDGGKATQLPKSSSLNFHEICSVVEHVVHSRSAPDEAQRELATAVHRSPFTWMSINGVTVIATATPFDAGSRPANAAMPVPHTPAKMSAATATSE
jgi:hypothetical protein